ncbi:MAG: riboflavin kinase [Tidjanibacter sp.]|nr:riboflavin kinase [Tidjanibacter sp.]
MKTNTLNIKLVGEVIYGNGLGRTIGFPTANLRSTASALQVACGVYAGVATVDGTDHPAVVNIGYSPSVVEGGELRVEAHLLDFEGNIYGHRLELTLLHFMRAEQKFPSHTALCAQIAHDCTEARKLLGGIQNAKCKIQN